MVVVVAEDEPITVAVIRTAGLAFLELQSPQVSEMVEVVVTEIILVFEEEEDVTARALFVAVVALVRVTRAVLVAEAENRPSLRVGEVSRSATAVARKGSRRTTPTCRKLWKPHRVRSNIASTTSKPHPTKRPRRRKNQMQLSS